MLKSDVYTIQSHKKFIIEAKIYSGNTERNTKQTLQLYEVAVSVAELTKAWSRALDYSLGRGSNPGGRLVVSST